VFIFIVLLFSGLTAAPLENEIDVAQRILTLTNQVEVVTGHTDIAYSNVDVSKALLNGVETDHWKADNCGNFVAKFFIEEIKELDG
jgi:hypothetical protein